MCREGTGSVLFYSIYKSEGPVNGDLISRDLADWVMLNTVVLTNRENPR